MAWYRVAMAEVPHGYRLRLKRGGRWMRPGGKALQVPAAGKEVTEALRCQTKNVVKHGFEACYGLKQFLRSHGYSSSMGSTGLERGNFFTSMRNVTPTAVWGRLSFLQFRVAVIWQQEVVKCLRRILCEDSRRDPSLQALLDQFVRSQQARAPSIWKSVTPEEPTNSNINHGFSQYVHHNKQLWTRVQEDATSICFFSWLSCYTRTQDGDTAVCCRRMF